jgi:translocator protein
MKIIKGVVCIALCQLAGLIGSFFTIPAIPTWYARLNKPFFSPPNWLFGPVWTSLYTLMGISLFLVWNKGGNKPQGKRAIIFFLIQLILNALWPVLFFGVKSPLAGLIDIILLWGTIGLTVKAFLNVSPWAGWLLIPYWGWVSFAMILNAGLWILNRPSGP